MQPVLNYESPSSDTPLPGARKALVLLLLINLMNYVDRQILAAVEQPIGNEFGVSAAATGWLATAFLFAYMLFSPLFGVLADRMSRWVIIGVGVVLWSVASGGSGAVHTFTLLVVMRLLIGVGEAAYGPVAPTIIADFYPVSIRGKVLAWFYAAIPVGSALGYVIGGLFHAHWHWAFYATLPPGILLGVMCFFMREPPLAVPPAAVGAAGAVGATTDAAVIPVKRRAGKEDYLALLRIPSYVLNTIGMTAMTFAIGGIAFFMPRWLQTRGLDPEKATPIFGGIVVVSGLVATIAGGMLGDKLRSRFTGSYFIVSGVGMLVGFPFFLLMLVTPFPWCWPVIFIAVFCLFFNTGPSNTIIANVTSPAVRATAFAMNILVIHAVGDALSPPVIGFVAAHSSLDVGFVVVSVMMVIGGVVWLLGARHLGRDTLAAGVVGTGQLPAPSVG